MFKKIKEYITYRQNVKIAKREIAEMLSSTLPTIREFTENKADILNLVKNTALAAKDMEGTELVNIVIDTVANMFSVSHERFIDIGSYLISLSPEEIQKILVHSMVETIDKSN